MVADVNIPGVAQLQRINDTGAAPNPAEKMPVKHLRSCQPVKRRNPAQQVVQAAHDCMELRGFLITCFPASFAECVSVCSSRKSAMAQAALPLWANVLFRNSA